MDRLLRLDRWFVVTTCCIFVLLQALNALAAPVVIDHRHTEITQIPQAAIEQAKTTLHIAYGHTSHGSQITTGMSGLVNFANNGGLGLSLPADIFAWNNGGSNGALDLEEGDGYGDGWMDHDVGYYPNWVDETRAYLDDASHSDVNVVMWSWCGQASGYTQQQMMDNYLNPMAQLELEYPNVTFVYMTGHLDGGGDNGNLNQRNQQIRDYCNTHEKVLYDFADIESYDPDGQVNYMLLDADDACAYDSDANGSLDRNWAIDWQNSHTQGVDWYSCGSAHSQPLNANLKAYAAWWLWARLGGWNPSGENQSPVLQTIGNRQVTCDQELSFTVSATDLDGSDTLTYNATPLPNGAAFDTQMGTFRWTPAPSEEGDHQVTFSVVDDGAPQGSDQESITITVNAPGTTPSPPTDSSSDSGCFINSLR